MKIALIKKEEISDWVSCRSITQNLEQVYRKRYGGDVTIFCVPEVVDKFKYFQVFNEIKRKKIESVIFIDHKPTPLKLVQSMDRALKDYSAQIIFHVFGDFTLFSPEWNLVEDILKKRPCHFITASESQRNLLAHFVNSENLSVVPFPVSDNFSYSKELRKTTREMLGLNYEQVFIYSGRLSVQKNVIDLIRSFESSVKQMNVNAKLLICGDFDDLGVPYLGKVMPDGHYESLFLNELKLAESVIYLGSKKHEELCALYCASDAFVSLSTHNDEDYGMSPAEAICCGLPCVLSSWGGFNSFHSYFSNRVSLVGVNVENDSVSPDLIQFRKIMLGTGVLNELDREALSNEGRRILGSKRTGELLDGVLPLIKSFNGFTPQFKKFSACYELNPKAPFRSGLGGYSNLYKEIYKSYQEV